ncbi:MAG: hypothetical protein WCO99_11055 [Planctomycetota bacterium]|jgi:hypothetical protein
MPCRRDFADVALAAEDRAAVLEAAQVLSDHLPVEAGALAAMRYRSNGGG